MCEHHDQLEDLVATLANQIHRYDLQLEQMERVEGIVALGAVKLTRLLQAAAAEVELMKNQLAGITPLGMDPTPPP